MPVRLEDIVERLQKSHPDTDVDLVRRAYIFSAKAHQGQTRLSGESYLNHPIEVAAILANLKLDAATVAAGLIKDNIEDTTAMTEEIKEMFGEEVARLVDGMTKLARMELQSREQREAENFRKMIVAMAKDIRVILIKLADRLHNMRTLKALPPEKQKRIAQETLDIYAPLANRMGISKIKIELEDLSFMYLNPEEYQELVRKVNQRRIERESYINELIEIMKKQLAEHGYQGEVKGRPKHFYSIYQKMLKQGIAFEDIYDLIAIRIITDTKVNCYAILGLIHSLWTPVPGRFKDFIGVPKSNLYQSLHTTIIGPKGERVEFQIRTDEMHRIAEEGIAAHWKYKDRGRIDTKDNQIYNWLRQMIEWQKDLVDSKQLMDSIKVDLFPDVVYVFTPKGDVKELIRGATPVDLAFAIHTEIGNRCVGAKVNGKIVPLRYNLKSGDTVEIITNPNHVPSKDWLKFVKTPRARAKLKHIIKVEERIRSLDIGRKILEKEFQRIGVSHSALTKLEKTDELLKEHNTKNIDDLFVLIGYGKLSVRQVIRKVYPEKDGKEEVPERVDVTKPRQLDGGVKVKGIDDILLHFSKCCSPVPGDKIIGYITRGRGLSIHAGTCPNVAELDFDKDRLITVDWDVAGTSSYPVRISVLTIDRPGLLASVSSSITSSEANISHADISTTEEKKAVLNFVIEVKDLQHLERVIQKIEQLSGVLQVRRLMGR